MSFAREGKICFSEEIVPRISSRFETNFIATTTVKGISQPIGIYGIKKEIPPSWHSYAQLYHDFPLIFDPQLISGLKSALLDPKAFYLEINGGKGSGKSSCSGCCASI